MRVGTDPDLKSLAGQGVTMLNWPMARESKARNIGFALQGLWDGRSNLDLSTGTGLVWFCWSSGRSCSRWGGVNPRDRENAGLYRARQCGGLRRPGQLCRLVSMRVRAGEEPRGAILRSPGTCRCPSCGSLCSCCRDFGTASGSRRRKSRRCSGKAVPPD
jgi:hypothetical protein